MYSWYLDSTANNWYGLINDDYSTIFPVSYTKKFGIKQFIQPIFTRQFEVMGDGFTITQSIKKIKKDFKLINFRSSQILNLNQQTSERQHQIINLKSDLNYSSNAKRLIKKSNQIYTYQNISDLTLFVELIKKNLAKKIKEFTPENIKKLEKLMQTALKNNKGECIGIFENNNFVGAGFFFKDKNTITYLKGISTNESKKKGAMYGLIDFVIKKYQQNYSIFDFGGSMVKGVSGFYKKFGAIDEKYNEYTINQLPLWFNTLKKIRNNV